MTQSATIEDPDEAAFRRNQGEVVRRLLRAAKVTNRELALSFGLSEGSISQKINGHTPFSTYELALLGIHLSIDPSLFFKTPDELWELLQNRK